MCLLEDVSILMKANGGRRLLVDCRDRERERERLKIKFGPWRLGMGINTICSVEERENGPLLGLVMMALVRRMNLVWKQWRKCASLCVCVWSGYIYMYIYEIYMQWRVPKK